MPDVTFGLHWLRFSTPADVQTIRFKIGGEFSDQQGRGAFNQPFHVQHESGARVYYGSPRDHQPAVVEVPGEACERDLPRFIRALDQLEGKPTRVDPAADLEPDNLARRRLREMYAALKREQVDTAIPTGKKGSFRLIKSHAEGEGWTLYVGSEKSQRFLRVYDRRGPLRLEWQHKVDRRDAKQIRSMIVNGSPKHLWQLHARSTVFPMSWYRELLDPSAPELEPKPAEFPEFEQLLDTLKTQIGPTLWALQQMGFPIDKLARKPENPSGDFLTKWQQISHAADDQGFNGDALRRALTRKRPAKLKPVPKPEPEPVDSPF